MRWLMLTILLSGCAGTQTTDASTQVWYCFGLCAFLQNTTDTHTEGETND